MEGVIISFYNDLKNEGVGLKSMAKCFDLHNDEK